MFDVYYLTADMMAMGRSMVQELLGAFPGIDEAMSFAEVMRLVRQFSFVIIKSPMNLQLIHWEREGRFL